MKASTTRPRSRARKAIGPTKTLDLWLTNPQAFAPGTSMAFPGVPDIKKRADIIAYLRSNADSPVPLPEAAPAADKGAEAPAAPAEAAPEAPAAAEPAAPEAPAAPEPATEAPAAPASTGSAGARGGSTGGAGSTGSTRARAGSGTRSTETPPAAEAEPAPSEPSMGEPLHHRSRSRSIPTRSRRLRRRPRRVRAFDGRAAFAIAAAAGLSRRAAAGGRIGARKVASGRLTSAIRRGGRLAAHPRAR